MHKWRDAFGACRCIFKAFLKLPRFKLDALYADHLAAAMAHP